jgi:hypothetical protein
MGSANGRHQDEMNGSGSNEEDMFESQVNPFCNDEADGTNANSRNGGTTNAMNGARGERTQRVKVRFSVANVDRHPAIKEEGAQ